MFKKAFITAAVCGLLAVPALADQLELTGVLRDFKRGDRGGGHLDFETAHMSGRGGYGHVIGLVTPYLSDDLKPVYNPVRPAKDTIYSAHTLDQWYRDDDSLCLSKALVLTLDNSQDQAGGVYTYQSDSFFPLDGQLFGNQNFSHNYHFTFELHTSFSYAPGQYFTFIGDDDVWVYVNGQQVIDLGGVHPAVTGSVLLFDGKAFVEREDFATSARVHLVTSALAAEFAQKWQAAQLPGACPISYGDKYVDLGLDDSDACTLDFFFAERHTTESNFRIDTSIQLVEVQPTTVSALYD